MQLKISTDYAIRIVLYLASVNKMTSSKELSIKLGIPQNFIFKITDKLQKEDILSKKTGIHGGFALKRDPGQISLFEIISIMEITNRINRCLEEDEFCSRFATKTCPVRKFYTRLQFALDEELKKMTIGDLLG